MGIVNINCSRVVREVGILLWQTRISLQMVKTTHCEVSKTNNRVRSSIDNNGLLTLESDSMSTIFCKLEDWEQDTAYIKNMKSIGNFNRNSISSRCIYHILKSASSNSINGRGIAKINWNTLLEWSICVIIEITTIRAKITSSVWVKMSQILFKP